MCHNMFPGWKKAPTILPGTSPFFLVFRHKLPQNMHHCTITLTGMAACATRISMGNLLGTKTFSPLLCLLERHSLGAKGRRSRARGVARSGILGGWPPLEIWRRRRAFWFTVVVNFFWGDPPVHNLPLLVTSFSKTTVHGKKKTLSTKATVLLEGKEPRKLIS